MTAVAVVAVVVAAAVVDAAASPCSDVGVAVASAVAEDSNYFDSVANTAASAAVAG